MEREREEGWREARAGFVLFSMKAGGPSADLHKKSTSPHHWLAGERSGAGRGCVGPAAVRSWRSNPAPASARPLLGARSRLRQLQVAGQQADAIERLPGLQRQ